MPPAVARRQVNCRWLRRSGRMSPVAASGDAELVALGVGQGGPIERALRGPVQLGRTERQQAGDLVLSPIRAHVHVQVHAVLDGLGLGEDRQSTRLNSSHAHISYA